MGRKKSLRFPFFRRNGNGKKKNGNGNGKTKTLSPRKAIFEPIEPRILLSTDLSYAGAAAFDLTLRLDDATQTLKLIDNATSAAVAEQALSDTSGVVITGSSDADRLVVDFGTPFALTNGISFDDATSGDADTLEVTGKPNTWDIDGSDTGTTDSGVSFSGIESIAGGTDADIFTFLAGGSLSGAVDGGAGVDTLQASDLDHTWTLTGSDAGTLDGQGFSGIEKLVGGSGSDIVTIAGGFLSGVADGGGGSDTFTISRLEAGSTGSLTLLGGDGIDTVNIDTFLDPASVSLTTDAEVVNNLPGVTLGLSSASLSEAARPTT
jgi:Ca2+-binding RTX toxin-like protein